MPVAPDPADSLQQYAHPERLVTNEWMAAHLGDPGLVVVAADEDSLEYENGHLPGAVQVDWQTELNDQLVRDMVSGEAFAAMCSAKGIARDDTLVFYGDSFNWWASYALWVFTLFGHQDVRLLNGGRQRWVAERREITREPTTRPQTEYPVVDRDDAPTRAYREQVVEHIAAGRRLVDVRSPGEYVGDLMTVPGSPQEGALRAGHIPGALLMHWRNAANDDGTFKSAENLTATYCGELGLRADEEVITYCRIGERSAHTSFALTHLLGFDHVRTYDGSWTEWGNLVRVPIAKGSEPGSLTG
jgi:thiosulfate/3-mercaptopyruvate sulfurtransferase